ncbi:CDGSH iron-sulfur domain-containing protein [Conexibacter stalactiti]|uniref:CDGSH iron-sulfur domain-containing protein n=1 Tax=Conexibacter stalactiti TaxID=1940611 RepID=A0ABU4HYL5_9ACTN|nr:CDGSH iron-sulfur domain-containing protein [Conexibacter stalactiti]MDW5598318.1 CDGSH iron-sulfur domain-containing protein [Conexibacter stalactiti]MEC5038960.1 CDGSH iron-sulfur domain-containing protein [Conexibacter stalactiti]
MSSISTALRHGADSGPAIDLLPLGLRQRVSAEIFQALVLAGVASRADGRDELTAADLLDALIAATGRSSSARAAAEQAGPLPARAPAPARVTPYRDGPYLLRGAFELTDQDGEPIPCSRSTVALCRCGRSQIRPFCDGTHKLIDFRAQSGAEADVGAAAP